MSSPRKEGEGKEAWYAAEYDGGLREVLSRFRRGSSVERALEKLRAKDPKPWDPQHEIEVRLAALQIVCDYIQGLLGLCGAGGSEVSRLMALQRVLGCVLTRGPGTIDPDDPEPGLRESFRSAPTVLNAMLRDLEFLQFLTPLLEAEGIHLDADARGGAKKVEGRGHPATMLHVIVKGLLRERYPEWDGKPPFPGENSQELRDWIFDRLSRWGRPRSITESFASALPWDAAMSGSLFSFEDIDPRPRGPIWQIIKNLQRLQ